MKETGISSVRICKAITQVLGVVLVASCILTTQSPAVAGQPTSDLTQGEYLQWLVRASSDKGSLPANATTADCIKWAREHNVQPQGGWKPDAVLTRDVLAQTLAQLYGVDGQTDPTRALAKEGVVVPSADQPQRRDVLDLVGDSGFESPTAKDARDPGTPVGPRPKVVICHVPPGNPSARHTIRVSETAVAAHLAHGDSLGPCN